MRFGGKIRRLATFVLVIFGITGALQLSAGLDQTISTHFAVEFTEPSTDLDAVLEFCRRMDRLVQNTLRGNSVRQPIPVRLMLMRELNGGRWRWKMVNGEGQICFGADFRQWRNDPEKRNLLLIILLQSRLGLDPGQHHPTFPWWIAAALNDYFDRQEAFRGPLFLPHYADLQILSLAGAAVRPAPEWLEPPPEPGFTAEKEVFREYRMLTLDLAFRLSSTDFSVLAEWILRSAARESQDAVFAALLTEPVTALMAGERALFGLPATASDAEKRELAMQRMCRRLLFPSSDPLPARQIRKELTPLLEIPRSLSPEGTSENEEKAPIADLPLFAERNSHYARLAQNRIPELRELALMAAPKTAAALEKLIRLLGSIGRGGSSQGSRQIRNAVVELQTELDRQEAIERLLEDYETRTLLPMERTRRLLELAERRRDPLPPRMQRTFDRAEKEYLGQ